ncbi:MAG TPA: arsenate reductase (glutaredoxin) [Gammaproteobacteria bacterium]|nr:arsenate reductase (glutaredoxin) [Gammaproteobacteria bacterium]
MAIQLFHNPRCSKSRQTLALLEAEGIDFEVILYLDTPPDVNTVRHLLEKLDYTPRQLMRKNESKYRELELDNDTLSEEALIQAMVAHPILIERPILVTDAKAAIGRPPEKVLEIL